MGDNADRLVKFIRETLGIPFEHDKPVGQAENSLEVFLRLKSFLIDSKLLLPMQALASQGWPLYIFNNITEPDRESLADKAGMLIMASFTASKKLLFVSFTDPALHDILQKENAAPFDKGVFIFKDDLDSLSPEQQKKLIAIEPKLILKFFEQQFKRDGNN